MNRTEKIFTILGAVCAGTAIAFLIAGNGDATFMAGVFGCVSWFLGYRAKLKAKNDLRAKERELENKKPE
jgi:hypothetical protein